MMVETHMLKPYKQRVEGTYELMKSMIEIVEEDHATIKQKRTSTEKQLRDVAKTYVLDWEIDTTKASTLNFKGYEGRFISSHVTGAQRLKYDRNKPFTKAVTYQNYYKPKVEVTIPKAYIIPQGWYHVIDLLKLNQVDMHQLKNDSIIKVESYRISGFETRQTPYEGHYQHYNTTVNKTEQNINFAKGDYIIDTHQYAFRYLLETLEPQAPDSFFNWNFFDTVLQQKEGFSPYVWEDKALELLNNDPELKEAFNRQKKESVEFSNNWYAQLDWIYKQSNYYEKAHMQYPVYRVN